MRFRDTERNRKRERGRERQRDRERYREKQKEREDGRERGREGEGGEPYLISSINGRRVMFHEKTTNIDTAGSSSMVEGNVIVLR